MRGGQQYISFKSIGSDGWTRTGQIAKQLVEIILATARIFFWSVSMFCCKVATGQITTDWQYYNEIFEWGWTARIAIARHAFARHFWQQNYCSTQIISFARIQLILAKPDSSKWQKKWQLLDSSSSCHFFCDSKM